MPVAFLLLALGAILVLGGVKNYSIPNLFIGRIVPRDSSVPIDSTDTSTYTSPDSSVHGTPGKRTGNQVGSGILGFAGKIIGMPFQGTHAKDFNVRGGSDNWQSENAIDVSVPVGTPVYAPVSGTVVRAGPLPGNPGGRFAGQRVTVQSSDNAFYFAHLSNVAVKEGQKVKAGEILGQSGAANGVNHLHFAVENGSPLDWIVKHV